jgi:hypothetical protein
MTETCGYPTASGTPCQHPTTEDGDPDRCWEDSHNEAETDAGQSGRPRAFDDQQTRQRVLVAVGQGLKVRDQAALAGVSPDTLRRALCCVDAPREPALDADPCEFCADYAQAHANGAREVLNDCRPEFVASASYGYVKEEKHDVDQSGELELTAELDSHSKEMLSKLMDRDVQQ